MYLRLCYSILFSFSFHYLFAMRSVIQRIEFPPDSIGARFNLCVHRYTPINPKKRIYIQASLHADEIPGLLVCNHLIKLLDLAAQNDEILDEIIVVPYANPIGLSQQFLGSHIGRFALSSGVNFNRNYPDILSSVAELVKSELSETNETHNVNVVRNAIISVLDNEYLNKKGVSMENKMKYELFKMAVVSDVVLDLHCDNDAVMHIYTHTRLWSAMADLAAELGSHCHLLAENSGGSPFDEACSGLWDQLAARYPSHPLPLACQSVTVELRGERDVTDEFASKDAAAIIRFLQRRNSLVAPVDLLPLPPLLRDASPLTGVDMVEAEKGGVVVWHKNPGDVVCVGDLLGEIVDIEDPHAERLPVVSRADGVIYGRVARNLVFPGVTIIKVAGSTPLSWRAGNLLTSR